jgi:hypothetical protein
MSKIFPCHSFRHFSKVAKNNCWPNHVSLPARPPFCSCQPMWNIMPPIEQIFITFCFGDWANRNFRHFAEDLSTFLVMSQNSLWNENSLWYKM